MQRACRFKKSPDRSSLNDARQGLLRELGDIRCRAAISLVKESTIEKSSSAWHASVELNSVQTQKLVRRESAKFGEARVAHILKNCLGCDDRSERWKIARRLEGKRRGANHRRTKVCASASPSCSEWEKFLALAGQLGGFMATKRVQVCGERPSPICGWTYRAFAFVEPPHRRR